MSIDDAALMFKGWYAQQEQEFLRADWIGRKQTVILSDVTNKSFGGKGVDKGVKRAWPHPWDKAAQAMTPIDKLELRKKQQTLKQIQDARSGNRGNS